MILLNHPTKLGEVQPLQFTHPQVVGRPVINVTVWGNNLEQFDESISFAMNHDSFGCNFNFM